MCIRDRAKACIVSKPLLSGTYPETIQRRITIRVRSVSYTHLDVYKRQDLYRVDKRYDP